MTTRYIEIDSTYRDRSVNPNPGEFVVETNLFSESSTAATAKESISDNDLIATWKNKEFAIIYAGTATAGIRLVPVSKVLPDASLGTSSETDHLLLTSDIAAGTLEGQGSLQPHNNYYWGATLNVVSPVQSSRIIEYKYLGGNKCSIRTETNLTVSSGTVLNITDPGSNLVTGAAVRDETNIFVPGGPSSISFVGCVLVNRSNNNIVYQIESHSSHRNIIRVTDQYTTPITDNDKLEIRKKIPNTIHNGHMQFLNDFEMSTSTTIKTHDVIAINPNVVTQDQRNRINIGDFVEIQKDLERFTNVRIVGTDNKQIGLLDDASYIVDAYVGCTIRVILNTDGGPEDKDTSTDRLITGYSGGVDTLSLVAAGTGYTDAPLVAFDGGGGTGATGAALLQATTVDSITLTSGGSGYYSDPVATFSGGGATTQATATVALTGSVVSSITLTSAGAGYTSNPIITITSYSGVGATASVTLVAVPVASVALANAGSLYTSVPTVLLLGGGGTGATAEATKSALIVTMASPLENLMSLYDQVNAIIFSPVETRRINKYVNVTLPSYTNFTGAPTQSINLLNYTTAGTVGTDYTVDLNLSTVNGFYKGLYISVTDGVSHYFGYINDHIVEKAHYSAKPSKNYIVVDNDFKASFAVGVDSVVIASAQVQEPFNRAPYSKIDGKSERYSVLKYGYDNYTYLSHKGFKWPGRRSPVTYVLSLINLILPNKLLANGKGGFITDYPYIYVRFQNTRDVTSNTGIRTNDTFYSNNPNAEGVTFRVLMNNQSSDLQSRFVTLSGVDMFQTQQFNLDENIDFAVFLPNGELFETIEKDTSRNKLPNDLLQISAQFSLTAIQTGEHSIQTTQIN